MPRGRIAYLVGQYPAVSHTFIDREIDGLRRRGIEVDTHAMRPTPPEGLLTDRHRRDAERTQVVLPPDVGELLRAHARTFARNPVRYARTLATALRLSAGGLRNGLWQLFHFAEAALVLERLRRRDVRHLHAHFANAASMVALLVARLGGRGWSFSFTMHGPTEFDDVTRYALAAKVDEAAFVACIGDYCRSQLMKLVDPVLWDKLSIVRCGVVVDDREAAARPTRAVGPATVLCVGRLVPDKGQRVLLEAMAELARRGVGAQLELVGDGPDRAALERRVAELGLGGRVHLVGAVGHDRIDAFYERADVFCLPSFAEGIPVVLMDAMAHELPVVTTQIMGVPELVADGVTGALVEPGRVEALADALEDLLGDAQRRESFGRAGREVVVREFDADQAADGLVAALRQAGAVAG